MLKFSTFLNFVKYTKVLVTNFNETLKHLVQIKVYQSLKRCCKFGLASKFTDASLSFRRVLGRVLTFATRRSGSGVFLIWAGPSKWTISGLVLWLRRDTIGDMTGSWIPWSLLVGLLIGGSLGLLTVSSGIGVDLWVFVFVCCTVGRFGSENQFYDDWISCSCQEDVQTLKNSFVKHWIKVKQ